MGELTNGSATSTRQQWKHSNRIYAALSGRSIRFHVLVDGENGAEIGAHIPSFVTLDQVPVDVKFRKAKYKARAFEFFRLKYKFSKEDWVLHLDEESEIDDRVIEKTLEFIERGTADFGMVRTSKIGKKMD
ncbi:uncharacterized protein LDX57_007424 [Aspergillus melleus]|uniref:uncharacterized protein n=1 Tax=Aspergillus melleus TaxID=138277 RepID=UPI001E8CAF2E|nr:uncharacterized protein LDX57_007424 [Aspergillus melleus]KAH8429752.1 hypothetical protein LDX57_007424 [Aspergillus melleus]